jgi:hypothetical protein
MGDITAINELIRVLAINGNLLIVVPTGKPKIIFNAHRIYSYDNILKYLNKLKLIEFTLIQDSNKTPDIIYQASKQDSDEQNYGCGCFWFTKNN